MKRVMFVLILTTSFLTFLYLNSIVTGQAINEDYCDANNEFHLKQGGAHSCAGGCDNVKGCCGTLDDDCCTVGDIEISDDAECGDNLICVDDFCKDINGEIPDEENNYDTGETIEINAPNCEFLNADDPNAENYCESEFNSEYCRIEEITSTAGGGCVPVTEQVSKRCTYKSCSEIGGVVCQGCCRHLLVSGSTCCQLDKCVARVQKEIEIFGLGKVIVERNSDGTIFVWENTEENGITGQGNEAYLNEDGSYRVHIGGENYNFRAEFEDCELLFSEEDFTTSRCVETDYGWDLYKKGEVHDINNKIFRDVCLT